MTLHDSGERPGLPRQAGPESNGQAPAGTPREVPRNWKTYLVITLLIVVPLGYLYMSAQVSRDSGRDKADRADATGLTAEWPSGTMRRTYSVPIPEGAQDVAYFETNSLHTSSLYTEFTTTPKGLDTFLEAVGDGSGDLEKGHDAITAKQAGEVGWKFYGGAWSDVLYEHAGAAPDLAIAVDLSDPEKPAARVVSTSDY